MEGSRADKDLTLKDKPSHDENVYYKPDSDPTRPRYNRPKGEVGITIDVYDAVTMDPKEFHSHHALLANITDRLFDLLHEFPLEQIKGAFLELGLLLGIIFEKMYKGIIMSVSVESPEALDDLWAAQARGDICRLLQKKLITPGVLKKVGVQQLELRVRLWGDERTACREDLNDIRQISCNLGEKPIARAMVDKVKEYRKKLPDSIWTLRDEQAKFERDLSEMLRILKGVLPGNRQTISNLAEYEKCCTILTSKSNINMLPFKRYKAILGSVEDALNDITLNIVYPIHQIHVFLETSKQQQNKKNIRSIIQNSMQTLSYDFDMSSLRHHEWQNRLLANEERFLGFVSLIPLMVDALVDIDECLDEYMSGFQSK